MKATCPGCGTELNYEENINPVRCYNCGGEIPKEDVVETDDVPEENKEWADAEHAEIDKEAVEDGEIEEDPEEGDLPLPDPAVA